MLESYEVEREVPVRDGVGLRTGQVRNVQAPGAGSLDSESSRPTAQRSDLSAFALNSTLNIALLSDPSPLSPSTFTHLSPSRLKMTTGDDDQTLSM